MRILILLFMMMLSNASVQAISIVPDFSDDNIPLVNENFRELDYWQLHSLVDKGDSTSANFTQANLTTDNTWRDLDLHSIIPKDAKAVLLYVKLTDDAAGSELSFRKNGNYAAINISTVATQVANIANYADVLVFIDSGGKIEYKGSNLAFTAIAITVKGWLR